MKASPFQPYRYGYPIEVSVKKNGSATPGKHFSMGRVAIELAYVIPDNKTTYISDDGTNVGFFMYSLPEKPKISLQETSIPQNGTKSTTVPGLQEIALRRTGKRRHGEEKNAGVIQANSRGNCATSAAKWISLTAVHLILAANLSDPPGPLL